MEKITRKIVIEFELKRRKKEKVFEYYDGGHFYIRTKWPSFCRKC